MVVVECVQRMCVMSVTSVCVRETEREGVSHVHVWERFVYMCAYLCVEARMVTRLWSMFII